jgi:hypothetical protein
MTISIKFICVDENIPNNVEDHPDPNISVHDDRVFERGLNLPKVLNHVREDASILHNDPFSFDHDNLIHNGRVFDRGLN